ncbi:HD domain-containing protein [Jiangella aurantiaca]|uniref:HD domain-containing protein n=2 Tax=Jiangella aurantiaca TaxID=2530373 RepID=A0A4R5AKD6_9ACTN|nr:HD domain-containing protein [Jiangella aurantiaca]
MAGEQVRLCDLLAALSVATDSGMGQPPEKAIRSCLVATGLARAMALPEEEVRDVYLATLLRHLGCTATAAEEAFWFGGDELVSRPAAEPADFADKREMLAVTLSTGRGAGWARPLLVARALVGAKEDERILRGVCEAGAALAGRLGLTRPVRDSLSQVFERWDGKGTPVGLAGDQITLPARIADVATQVEIFHRVGGVDAALAMVAERSGGWFDPKVADVVRRHGRRLLREIGDADPWVAVLEAEPDPVAVVDETGVDRVARAFAEMTDLKSTYTLSHSTQVSALATAAAKALGLPSREVRDLGRAGLLHDLGRIAVSSGIWEKRRPLTRAEWEQIRLHPYHTERILTRSVPLERLGRIAGLHHERLDGSGYHRAAAAAAIPTSARVLAAADAYQTLTQERPHRAAVEPERAADLVAAEAGRGRLDPDCVRAVIEAAGQVPRHVRVSPPAGLSDREIEVLQLVARGLSNRQIARELVISPRTAEHHVQHVYDKIGTSTRAGAALFAMEHDLLRR